MRQTLVSLGDKKIIKESLISLFFKEVILKHFYNTITVGFFNESIIFTKLQVE